VATSTDEDVPSAAPRLALLRCERLVIGHRGHALLPPIDLEIRRGELLIVLGRNGAGKSTWFKTLLGLVSPISGRVVRTSPPPRLAYVPQATSLDDLLPIRALDLVGWGRLSGWSFLRPFAARKDREACERSLERADAAHLRGRFYRELSRGEKQRVLFARALARGPDVALLDEPTAAMDTIAEREAMAELRRLASERNVAVVVVTQSIAVAAVFADRILFVSRAPAQVILGDRDDVLAHEGFRAEFGDLGEAPAPPPRAEGGSA
jgi:zinc transport system ATP-binding protein